MRFGLTLGVSAVQIFFYITLRYGVFTLFIPCVSNSVSICPLSVNVSVSVSGLFVYACVCVSL